MLAQASALPTQLCPAHGHGGTWFGWLVDCALVELPRMIPAATGLYSGLRHHLGDIQRLHPPRKSDRTSMLLH